MSSTLTFGTFLSRCLFSTLYLTRQPVAGLQELLPVPQRRGVERQRVVDGDRVPRPDVVLRYQEGVVVPADLGRVGAAGVPDPGQEQEMG